jgi:hypothetical protein
MADALRKRGLAYDHVDANNGVGGNWRSGIYKGVHIVSSKCSTAFADYPMPQHYPDFPSQEQMRVYLESYARDRGILSGIEFGRTVGRATPLTDESWRVLFDDGEEREYKGLVVCNGHHWDKRYPDYPGHFTGTFIHSKDYREPKQLHDKRVLVIGGGNSGCDLACDAARVGASCDLSLRSGYWFLPKTAFGRPLTDLPIWSLPVFMQRLLLRALVWAVIGDYRSYGLQRPKHKLFQRHPAFGTDLLNYLRQGRIKPRPDIGALQATRCTSVMALWASMIWLWRPPVFATASPSCPRGWYRLRMKSCMFTAARSLMRLKIFTLLAGRSRAMVSVGF